MPTRSGGLLADLGGLAPAAWAAAYKGSFAGLGQALPRSLSVATLQSLGNATVLLRIQHVFEAGEDPVHSQNATVSLAGLFDPGAAGFSVTAAVETSLGGVLPLASVPKWTLRAQGEATSVTMPVVPPPPAGAGLDVSLAASELRTFLLTVA